MYGGKSSGSLEGHFVKVCLGKKNNTNNIILWCIDLQKKNSSEHQRLEHWIGCSRDVD